MRSFKQIFRSQMLLSSRKRTRKSMDNIHTHISVFLILITVISRTNGFILEEKCDAPIQCTCSSPTIDCSNKRLPRIPQFNMSNPLHMMYLQLQHNRIIVVPEDSFVGISADQMYIDMSSNHMRDIHPLAFKSIQDKITILKLDHNLLTTVPVAVANLTKLVYLDVHANPIKSFDQTVLEPLGGHLEIFYAGSDSLAEWPSELSFLKHLKALHLFDFTMNDLPVDAFKSVATSLVNFEIDGSNLTRIPHAVCNLQRVVNFYFTSNINLDDDDILPVCNSALTSVTSVTMDNNNLVEFPRVFTLFPSMSSLSLSSNPRLTSMSGVSVPESTALTSLTLRENNFYEIPQHIGNLTNLRTLDFQSNNITELFDNDLDHLTHLTRLLLSNNPISLIDDHTFTNRSSLYQLSLDGTDLPTIPRTIQDLKNLHTLDFRKNKLNCSCDYLAWMKSWPQVNSIHITGECANPHFGEPIQTFILLELPRCQ
ncbi:leucine-rich repeat protein lrrA-like [Mercenaria mercenaria]|uniref:leucine-rich repeat protein lrrA-like n=1 Tax=Mercenaria mercenaria TaxID=6596 RepID=UPI00234F7D30|nr:leucine-rich repeat protein lrrA-like [Mercenaria mercenaria]